MERLIHCDNFDKSSNNGNTFMLHKIQRQLILSAEASQQKLMLTPTDLVERSLTIRHFIFEAFFVPTIGGFQSLL